MNIRPHLWDSDFNYFSDTASRMQAGLVIHGTCPLVNYCT